MMKTKMPFDFSIVERLTQLSKAQLMNIIVGKIDNFQEKEIITELNPFIPRAQRDWTRKYLIEETKQLFQALII